MTALAFVVFDHWFWHPYAGKGYQFWSGAASDLGELTLLVSVVAVIVGFWHHHNCHVHRCWRLSWHPHPEHGHPVCRRHHPDHDSVALSRANHE